MNVYKITYSISDYGVGLYFTFAETVVEALDELRRCVGPVDRIYKIEKGKTVYIQVVIVNDHFRKLVSPESTIYVYYVDDSWIVEDGETVESFKYYLDAESYAKTVLLDRGADYVEV